MRTHLLNTPNMRLHERVPVDVPVTISSILYPDQQATVVDLSEGGAQLRGCSLPVGTQIQIIGNERVDYATVTWSEVDRMGVRFSQEPRLLKIDNVVRPARPFGRPPAGARTFGRRVA